MRPILLDTCAALWMSNGQKLRDAAARELFVAGETEGGILVSPITAWEVGQLVSKGRLALALDPMRWFQSLLENGVALAELSPRILIASSFLPSPLLRDPADRIVAATARALDLRLMTADRPLLEFASGGHMHAVAC
jgi:PIN domain nuclease of toxin-antitoxin system